MMFCKFVSIETRRYRGLIIMLPTVLEPKC